MTELDAEGCFCRICSSSDESSWDDHDRKLISDVRLHGWHVVGVNGEPGWCYTLGLWHTYRSPEIAIFGLDSRDMAQWLNDVGEQVRPGNPPRPDEFRSGVIDGVQVTWRPVHDSWYEELFGYALWFAWPPPPILQLVWPDREGRFPWDDGVGDRCRADQPTCWRPIDQQPNGPWRPMAVHATHGWPEPEMLAFTTTRIAEGYAEILSVFHEEDGDWSFVDGGSVESSDDLRLVHAAHLLDDDPTLAVLADLPSGWEAYREDASQPWMRRPIDKGAE